jgi:hypothetical protein
MAQRLAGTFTHQFLHLLDRKPGNRTVRANASRDSFEESVGYLIDLPDNDFVLQISAYQPHSAVDVVADTAW